MGKKNPTPHIATLVRIPKPLHDRLRRISTERSIKESRAISISALVVHAVEQTYN